MFSRGSTVEHVLKISILCGSRFMFTAVERVVNARFVKCGVFVCGGGREGRTGGMYVCVTWEGARNKGCRRAYKGEKQNRLPLPETTRIKIK